MAGSPLSPEPALPGEFVSEDLRVDCARFLNEQRALIALRREPLPESVLDDDRLVDRRGLLRP
jgi:hypothetical protein